MKTILEFLKTSNIKTKPNALMFESKGKSSIGGHNWDSIDINFEYSYNGVNWTNWEVDNNNFKSLEITNNKPLYIRGNNPNGIGNDKGYFIFNMHGDDIYCTGNIMHLIDYTKDLDTIPSDHCFQGLFGMCTNLVTAPELPATKLTKGCYEQMFSNCNSLTTAPELPARILKESCYSSMFYNCYSMTTAPELPATTLEKYCYFGMFSKCKKLTTTPELPATTLAKSCYRNMFNSCVGLTSASELPALTLEESCYQNMFNRCENLKKITALFTTKPTKTYTEGWVEDVSWHGKFIKNKDSKWDVTGTYGIPKGWEVETI